MLTLTRTRPDSCLSDLTLDKLLASDLDSDSRAHVDTHLADCERCVRRLDEFRAALHEFQASGPARVESVQVGGVADGGDSDNAATADRADSVANAVNAGSAVVMDDDGQAPVIPLQPRRRRLAIWGAVGTALAAAAAVLMLVRIPNLGDSAEYTQRKGSDGQLGFYVKRADSIQPGAVGTIVYPDDRLRFTYRLDQAGYMAVLSIDGAGIASIYYPDESAVTAAAVPAGQDQPLPASTILDDTLGTETLYGMFCDRPVILEPIRAGLPTRSANQPWPAGCTVHTIIIEKRLP